MPSYSHMPEPPSAEEPTDAELAAYVAEACRELRTLGRTSSYRTVNYLLGLVQMEAEKIAQAAGPDRFR